MKTKEREMFFVIVRPWGELIPHSCPVQNQDEALQKILGGEPEFSELRFCGRVWPVATASDGFEQALEKNSVFPAFAGPIVIGPIDLQAQGALIRSSLHLTTAVERAQRVREERSSSVTIKTLDQVICHPMRDDRWFVIFNEVRYPTNGQRFPTKEAAQEFLEALRRDPSAQPIIPRREPPPSKRPTVVITASDPDGSHFTVTEG